MKLYKIYTKVRTIEEPTRENNEEGYYEVNYMMFDEDYNLVGEGTEDFSYIRLRNLKKYEVRQYSGRNNKNGSPMTETLNIVRVNEGSALKMSRALYGEKVARVERI